MPASCPIVDRYLEFARQSGLSPATRYTRGRTLRRLAGFLAPVPVERATAAQLAGWRSSLTAGDDTICTYVCDARRFYAWLVTTGARRDDPSAGLPSPRRARRLPRPIADAELWHAIAVAPARVRPWLVLAAHCGLRAKEIARLRRENVLDTASPPALLIAAGATKGRRERMVPLSAWALAELRPYLPLSGWVFPRADGKAGPNAAHVISHVASAWLHASGSAATLHQLRHWFGTMGYRGRRDLRLLQELMGHADPASTAGYAAIDAADAVHVVDALPVPAGAA